MKKYLLIIIMLNLLSATYSQQILRGTIISAIDKLPLPGASIRIKENNSSATADEKGGFSVSAPPAPFTIEASFIGFRKKEQRISSLPAEGTLTLTLEEDARRLQEVVVSTGYQEIPAERATGSFAHIGEELYNRQVSSDVLSRLKALAPSLLFDERGGGQSLSIRGRSTIYANDQPLIVLDNFPYEGDINNINPNDIESISILRDAAAASIWGARAGNGVIVITSKKGREGQPLNVEFNANTTVVNRPDLFYPPAISPSDYIDVEQYLFDLNLYNSDLGNTTTRPPVSPVVEILARQRAGTITSADAQLAIDNYRGYDLRKELEKHFYRRGLNQQYHLNFRGGSQKHSYFFSAGYDDNQTEKTGNSSNRLSLNARQSFSPLKNLELSSQIGISQSGNRINNTLTDLVTGGPSGRVMYPYTRLADEQGNHLAAVKDYRDAFKKEAEARGVYNWDYVPLDELELADNRSRRNDTRIQSSIKYELLKGFSATLLYQFERQYTEGRDLRSAESYFVRNLINRYTTFSGTTLTRNIPEGAFLNRSSSTLNAHSGRAQLNYSKSWKEHELHALAGTEIRELSVNGSRNRYYGYDENLGSSQTVNFKNSFSLYPSGSGLIPMEQGISSTTDRYRSYFANASYTYKSRYTVSGSSRMDQSNFFGLNRNQRAVPLWSAGMKWNVAREGFYDLSFLPELSLRASYGFNGNINKSVTALTTATFSSNTLTGSPGATISSPPNPELGWERTGIFNLGLDFGTRNRRLAGSIEYYSKKGLDLIGDSPLDPTSGLTSYRGNVAAMKGKGIDVQLNTRNIQRAFSWESAVLFSYTTDEITKYEVKPVFSLYMADASLNYSSTQYSPTPGKPLFAVYSRPFAGLDPQTGDPMGYVNGQPSSNYAALNSNTGQTVDSLVYHGRALPPVFGAFRNTFSYKSFSLSANISYRLGYYFRRSSIDYTALFSTGKGHSDYALRWQKPGDEISTTVPSRPAGLNEARDYFYNRSSVLVEKGDHIRLQDIQASWQLSRQQFRKLPLQQVQLYVYVNNAGILWRANDQGIDPDYPAMTEPLSISFGIKTLL
ncbi:SusC/RagA family TonB-linked outer membrane protein [Desertivirga xinjiangensis]|uniref:SusC/RagA family TonB-linked outer membrane protein n=1 Tax=Desertivirga xinjiangensis TaxID=539206 RepID=UPI002109E500|nr:SusC/RagA family TonB-linked outer membrane protein [Pedobacter xinjiangensis]